MTKKDEAYSTSVSGFSVVAADELVESEPDSDPSSVHHVSPHPASVNVVPTTRSCSKRFMVIVLWGSIVFPPKIVVSSIEGLLVNAVVNRGANTKVMPRVESQGVTDWIRRTMGALASSA